jgi:phage repressor protein C with HTH and peptisase S24 domain
MQNIRRGSSPSADRLAALCEALQLEFYIGPKRAPLPAQRGEDVALVDHFDLQVSAGAGSLGVAAPAQPVPFNAQWLRKRHLRPAALSVLEVRGDSMEPILFDGDPILVDKQKSKPTSGQMYVVVRRDSVQVKQVTVLRKAVELVSENDAYPTERIDAHDAPDFYKVRWFGHFIKG